MGRKQIKMFVEECRNEINMANKTEGSEESKRRKKADIVSYLIKELGISPALNGYYYLKEAILYLEESEEDFRIVSMNKVYSEIAYEFAKTPNIVERAIRHAIEKGWLRGNFELQDVLFGYSMDRKSNKPTNSQFIFTIVDALK